MDKEQLKLYFRRFRRWQRSPIRYTNHSNGEVKCQNCGTTFNGNYCLICGQKAGVGRIDWHTLRQGVMELWDIDTRSLPYTILQLLLRPGYLISDYISGRRQVSFPPVKMLFILAIVKWLVIEAKKLFDPVAESNSEGVDEAVNRSSNTLHLVFQWMDANEGWSTLLVAAMFIFPTWLLFYRSPRHTRHTLAEGFFIQAFLASIFEIATILHELVPLIGVLIPIYYVVAYKQLFGYDVWGTTWRVTLCFVIAFGLMVMCITAAAYTMKCYYS